MNLTQSYTCSVEKLKTIFHFLVCGFAAIVFGACSPSMDDYKSTVSHGIKTVPHVSEILALFPDSPTDHFITQFGFDRSKPVIWNTEVFFGGRYVLHYHVYVTVDYLNDRIVTTNSSPGFTLLEVSRVYNETPNAIAADFSADHKFGEADWEKVVAARGDFSVIGISIDTNHAVARFDDYVYAERKDRVQVK